MFARAGFDTNGAELSGPTTSQSVNEPDPHPGSQSVINQSGNHSGRQLLQKN